MTKSPLSFEIPVRTLQAFTLALLAVSCTLANLDAINA